MSVRVYTVSAIAVTASAVAGLWFGAIIASRQPGVVEAVPSAPAAERLGVTSATAVPPF